MRVILYILKRSNGCYGIYKNGKTQQHLISNSFLNDNVECFINRILLEVKAAGNQPEIIFTSNENEFQHDLPKLEEMI